MFYVDLNEGEAEDAEDIIKKSIEEIHKSAKGTKRTLLIVYYYLNEGKKKMSLKCPLKRFTRVQKVRKELCL
jgi:ABC-type enterochelin transport system substrate-binding protein